MIQGDKSRGFGAIVIGGGPAGLFLAARLAGRLAVDSGGAVLLLERMPKPGRKLLASGSGQCNVTHQGSVVDFLEHYGGAGRFLKKSLHAFSNEDLAAWLGERGVELEAGEGGKLFPVSRRATDVLSALLGECDSSGVTLVTDARVSALCREGGGEDGDSGRDAGFRVEVAVAGGAPRAFHGTLVALAAGGLSYPGTGSSGDGHALAASLGHSIVPPRPALTPVTLRDPALCALAGLSFTDLPFAIRRRGKKIGDARGDILVTHEGLSGPGILDASRGLEPGDLLELDFSGLGQEAFRAALASGVASAPRSLARTVLGEAGLPRRLSELICGLAGLGEDARCSDLRRGARDAMALMATAFPAEVAALGGFEKAMVTAGGVALVEVDPGTMESRVTGGLYFAGEVLDYDGDTGGFNLQAAFSTADAAARAMATRLVSARPAAAR
jgi:predicted Rossmann fold flavoprotein